MIAKLVICTCRSCSKKPPNIALSECFATCTQTPATPAQDNRGRRAPGLARWDSACFHLCQRQGRFAPTGSRPGRGAGKHFAWLEVCPAKVALSRSAHQPSAGRSAGVLARRVTQIVGRLRFFTLADKSICISRL